MELVTTGKCYSLKKLKIRRSAVKYQIWWLSGVEANTKTVVCIGWSRQDTFSSTQVSRSENSLRVVALELMFTN